MTKFFKLFQDTDFLTGLLTLAIASFSYAGIGDDMKDWVFPLMACYTLFSISAVFLIKSLIKIFQNNIEKNIIISQEQIPSILNVIFFSLIVFGFFSIFYLSFNLTVLAAILAVIGYSLNDTIVVSDRIRENYRKKRKSDNVDVINRSLNQMLGRTLITSLTNLLVLFALLILGGDFIQNFAIALICGVIIGTYSSIYVLCNTLISMNLNFEDLAIKRSETYDDGMP